MTASAGWGVVEYRGREGMERLADDWRRLYAAMPLRTGFHAYETHLAYLEHLMAAPDKFRCIALTDGERLRAICPLEARLDRILGIPIRVWGMPLHPHFMLSDVIGPEDDARRELLPAVVALLRSKPEGRRLLVVGPLPQESVVWNGLQRLSASRCSTDHTMPASVFDCQLSFDELMARLSKHFRRNLRSHRNKLSAYRDARFASATGAEIMAAFDVFLDLEASGWKGSSGAGSAIRLHPKVEAFYRTLASTLGGDGSTDRCEINSLYADDRCLASHFCMHAGKEYAMLKIAYDEGAARLGPGLLLLERTLERCCADPAVKRLNLESDGSWQRDWHPDLLLMQQTRIAIGRWSGSALVAALRFRFGLGRRVVRWMRARTSTVGPRSGTRPRPTPREP